MIITRQTQKERELLNIAKEITNSFEYGVAAIGGSLMLSYIGARKLREANDIDIVLNSDYYAEIWKSHGDCHFLSEYLKNKLKNNNIKVQKHIKKYDFDEFFDMFMNDEPSPYDDVFSFVLEDKTKIDFLLCGSNRFF